jgi:hypothetical protein
MRRAEETLRDVLALREVFRGDRAEFEKPWAGLSPHQRNVLRAVEALLFRGFLTRSRGKTDTAFQNRI